MLEDRDYMRQPDYGPRVSFTVALLIVNTIVFVAEMIAVRAGVRGFIGKYLSLSIPGLKSGYIWQLLTFQFMHANVAHLLGNSLLIFFCGRAVEAALGGRRFLLVYFASGVIGGLVQLLFSLVISENDAVMGASAGGMGLVGAFAMLSWDEQITLLLLYIIPVNMRGKTLFWLSLALVLLYMLAPQNGIANAAHLGGLLAGFFYVRQIAMGRWHFPQWRLPSRPASAAPRELAAKHAGKKSIWNKSKIPPDEDLSPAEYLQKEVDPILDKISAHGIQSLTAREREILEKARSRMNKR
jgi:membrane associated rhomboid family serine protease